MKKTTLFLAGIFCMLIAVAQKEGKVIYQRTIQMQIAVASDDPIAQAMPRTRTDKFELNYGNNKSIYKHIDEETNADEVSGNGMQIRMMAPGQNDIVFIDLSNNIRTEQREIFDKKFIVTDTIQKLNWKLTGETKNILGHVAQQAIATRTGMRMQTSMENGKIERREIPDTTVITAWYAPSIPVSAGPEVPGQLPGLILAVDINNGRMVYKAIEISQKADVASITAPTKGKKATAEEFRTEREKMMLEMRNNRGGRGNQVIRMQ